jgi:hypothetical protein
MPVRRDVITVKSRYINSRLNTGTTCCQQTADQNRNSTTLQTPPTFIIFITRAEPGILARRQAIGGMADSFIEAFAATAKTRR